MSTGTVWMKNTDTNDLFVKVFDRNAPERTKVFDARINEDDSVPLTVTINGDYEARLDWEAVNPDDAEDKHTESDVAVSESSEFEVRT